MRRLRRGLRRRWRLGLRRCLLRRWSRLLRVRRCRDGRGKCEGEKRAREADRLLGQVIKEHPDTVWAELARQAQKMSLSVEWQAVK